MLNRTDIQLLKARFEEQRPTFVTLASDAEAFIAAAVRGKAIRHMVTSRAKSPDSLERKLWNEKDKRSLPQFANGLSPPLKDLAAARVLVYVERDVDQVVDALTSKVSDFGVLAAKAEKYDETNRPEGYRAVHLHIAKAADTPPCEVQVCTLTAHIWNELQHDIVYKQHDRKADTTQKALLDTLRGALEHSANVAKLLMAHTDARLAESKQPLDGPESLRRFLEAHEGDKVVRGEIGDMFNLLDGLLKPLTPHVLHEWFEAGIAHDTADAMCRDLDPDDNHKEVGRLLVRLLPSFKPEVVAGFVADAHGPSLWKFAVRAAARLHEQGGR